MNKLISLSSEGKLSIIESVVEKVNKKTEEKKNQSVANEFSGQMRGTSQEFDIIKEEDEEMIEEEEIEKEVIKVEQEEVQKADKD